MGGLCATNSWLRRFSKEMSRGVGYTRERDCLLSQSSVQFLRERLFDMSDAFNVLICNDCGVISNDKEQCHICKNNELIQTNTPYASKLLFQMLNGCLIKTKFHSVTE
jgi:DNA-directed RNA polymerase II subunit RPB2